MHVLTIQTWQCDILPIDQLSWAHIQITYQLLWTNKKVHVTCIILCLFATNTAIHIRWHLPIFSIWHSLIVEFSQHFIHHKMWVWMNKQTNKRTRKKYRSKHMNEMHTEMTCQFQFALSGIRGHRKNRRARTTPINTIRNKATAITQQTTTKKQKNSWIISVHNKSDIPIACERNGNESFICYIYECINAENKISSFAVLYTQFAMLCTDTHTNTHKKKKKERKQILIRIPSHIVLLWIYI